MRADRRNFPAKVKADAFTRAAGKCEECNARLFVGKFHYDHVIPDAMGGEPTLENCKVLCLACHGEKTADVDVPAIAKVKRVRQRHLGIKRPSTFRKMPPGYKWDWRLKRAVKDERDSDTRGEAHT